MEKYTYYTSRESLWLYVQKFYFEKSYGMTELSLLGEVELPKSDEWLLVVKKMWKGLRYIKAFIFYIQKGEEYGDLEGSWWYYTLSLIKDSSEHPIGSSFRLLEEHKYKHEILEIIYKERERCSDEKLEQIEQLFKSD